MGVLTDFFAATPDELASLAIELGPLDGEPLQPAPQRGGFRGLFRRSPAPAPAEPAIEPAGPARTRLPTVASTGILNTQVGVLDQCITGTPFASLEGSGAIDTIARDNGPDGPWVFPLRRALRDGLADLSDGRIMTVAQAWGLDQEMDARGEDFRILEGLITELRELALTARGSNRDLYLWVSL